MKLESLSKLRKIFSETSYNHLENGIIAFEKNQSMTAAVWAAVFLEGFLSELINELGISSREEDLNNLIQKIRNYSKNHNPSSPNIPDDIIKRCDEIRNIRNRLVHYTGMPKNTTEQDARTIFVHLSEIINWHYEIKKNSIPNEHTENIIDSEGYIPVFISTITPHSLEQRSFLDKFNNQLLSIGIKPVTCKIGIYDKKDPINKVRSTINDCCALIVIGLERSHVYFLKDKEGTNDEKEEIHRKYTSGWLHLEAGIANALGKDVFVICEKDICSDGIFDRGWNTYPVVEISGLNIEGNKDLQMFFEHLKEWVKKIK